MQKAICTFRRYLALVSPQTCRRRTDELDGSAREFEVTQMLRDFEVTRPWGEGAFGALGTHGGWWDNSEVIPNGSVV